MPITKDLAMLGRVGIQIGETIGDYMVEAMLGRGGMGCVYRVRNLISDRHDALKVLVSDIDSSPQIAERFLREIKVQASLSHPNIAALHTALRHQNQLLMVMEYVDGHTLDEKLRFGLPLGAEAVAWTIQLLSALDYAHARGIVHRDIKPANIIISRSGLVKLLDFGIASRQDGELRLTAAGTPIGTLYYMSPEQIRTKPLDGRADIYSTGILLYEALAGRRPIDGEDAYTVMQAHLGYRPVAPHLLNTSIPLPLSNAIMKAIEKDPADRFQSAGEFQASLSEALRIMRSQAQTVALTPPPPPPPVHERQSAPQPVALPVPPSNPVAYPNQTPVPDGWDPQVLEQARQNLAQFIGPMAKVLIKRALKDANTISKLYDLLAAEIADEKDRKKFLSLRPR
jgi:serine/threonine protein kinase